MVWRGERRKTRVKGRRKKKSREEGVRGREKKRGGKGVRKGRERRNRREGERGMRRAGIIRDNSVRAGKGRAGGNSQQKA